MDVSRFEIGMLFSLALMIVLMSFSAPVFGLTDNSTTNSSDIPEFNVSDDRFDVAGDFPEQATNPSGGELVFTENETNGLGISQVMISGSLSGTNNGHEVFVSNGGTSSDPRINITINKWDADAIQWTDKIQLDGVGDTHIYTNQSADLVIEFEGTSNTTDADGTGNTQVGSQFTVEKTPSDEGVFSGIPLVGGIASGVGDLAGIVGWIGSVVFYLFLTLGETILNVVGMLLDVTVYLISMMHWMFSTYFGIITGAPGWVAVFMALPGVLLFGLLAKFVMAGIKLLPTT